MTELYEKSLRKLELDNVLAQLADCANSEDGKDRCRALLPLDDAEEIRLLQQQTTAACGMIVRKGAPGFHELKPVAASLERADRGGCLTPVELLRIAGVLRCIRNVKAYYSEDGEPTVLDVYFQELSPNRYLEEKITNSILSEEEIADAASSELADIRRHMRIQSAKVKDSLQKIISSPSFSKYLRDPIITLRGDRYVVPVKSEYKSEIPGLVHDVSSTGSTFFIEPMSAVNANNALRELLIREKKEIERILAALSAEAASFREGICHSYEMLVQLDCIFARARLSHKMDGMEPEIRTNASLELVRARHPLIDRKKVVPVSLRLGSDFDTLIITGPNTGGKTVTLKTIGLLTLMAECGLHIPADHGSAISVFRQVLADIGDEQSIEQSLSTFSAHMKNIVDIVADCDRDTLCCLTSWARARPGRGCGACQCAHRVLPPVRQPRGCHDALCRAEALCHAHGGRHERLVRVRRGDAAADLPPAHRHPRQIERLCHFPPPRPAGADHRQGKEPCERKRPQL